MTRLELQRTLGRVNRWRLRPALPGDVPDALEKEAREAQDREIAFVEEERASVAERASHAPAEPDAFVTWFEDLEKTGPGQHDPLFDWLEASAGLEQMRWFVEQEVAGEAGFDDLVALTQVKMPRRAKLELARNYWDEMGQGHESGMHGPMLGRLAEELGIAESDGDRILPEPLAQGNLLVALAVHRRYAFHSIGALGAIELTAPGRATKVNAGLRRLGVGGDARRYFALHATLDVAHSREWNAEVLRPLVEADARVARAIAEGALMRLLAGERCFVRYRRELGLP
jgi:pyrroloquinoline quinone (PQQ) biosynthesis protein C